MPNSSACHAYVMWAELDHSHFWRASETLIGLYNGNQRYINKYTERGSLQVLAVL